MSSRKRVTVSTLVAICSRNVAIIDFNAGESYFARQDTHCAEKGLEAGRVTKRRSRMDRILVSGVSGPIGTALLASFEPSRAQIVRLVRGRAQNGSQIPWDPLAPLSPAEVSGFDT